MPPSPEIEAWLQAFGVENFTLDVLPLDAINRESSLTNQARVTAQAVDDEVVAQYALAMERAEVFPPIVVVPQGDRYVTIDGNHRYVAADLCGRATIEAYIVNDLTDSQKLLLTFAANTRHGLPTTTAERIQQGLTLVNHGVIPAEAARTLNVAPHHLYRRIQAQEAATQLAEAGIDVARFSQSTLSTLSSIRNHSVRTEMARWITDQRINTTDATTLIRQVNDIGTEAEQLRFIDIESGRRTALNRATARGRITVPSHITALQNALNTIDNLATMTFDDEATRTRVSNELRTVLSSRALDGSSKLRRIAANLTE